jgi:hypothetical protein
MPTGTKIEEHGLTDRVLEMKAAGHTNVEIARECTRLGCSVTGMTVGRFLDRHETELRDARTKAIAHSRELGEQMTRTHLDAIAQLLHVNEETLSILRTAKAAADYSTALQAIKRVEAQLLLQSQLLGQLQQPQTVIFNVAQVAPNREKRIRLGQEGEAGREGW